MRLELPAIPERWAAPLPYDGPPVAALALSGSLLAIADDDGTVSLRPVDVAGPDLLRWRPDFAAGRVDLSGSGTALLVRSRAGDLIEVRDVRSGSSFQLVSAVPGIPLAVGGFAWHGQREILLASTGAGRLQVIDPASGQVLSDRPVRAPRGLVYRGFSAMADRDSVIAVGYYADEAKDSLVRLSVSRLLAEDGYLEAALHRPEFGDYAYRLAAGPAGPDQAVIYRDAEDDEDPDDEEDDPNRPDVHGLNGVYFRRLDDAVAGQRIPFTTEIRTGDPIFATPSFVAIATAAGLRSVDRSTGTAMLLPAGATAVHPSTTRAVVWAGGRLSLITVPS
ncbi:MAG: hypothetical protein V7637_1807 [Mycobacteriales bacterium]|jgi:hypothetical protein